jgi:tetratricopeptide (TPR) repeat protein
MLAAALRALGQRDEAEELYRCALAIGRAKLGEDHFEVLAWKHNLAGLLEDKGELASAESLYCEVLDAHERLFGGGNDDTRIVVANLARVYEREGRHEEAQALRASWQQR